MTCEELKHRVIEQAKAAFKADGCDMDFDQCLATSAGALIRPPFSWVIGERNGGWSLDVWLDTTTTTTTDGDPI